MAVAVHGDGTVARGAVVDGDRPGRDDDARTAPRRRRVDPLPTSSWSLLPPAPGSRSAAESGRRKVAGTPEPPTCRAAWLGAVRRDGSVIGDRTGSLGSTTSTLGSLELAPPSRSTAASLMSWRGGCRTGPSGSATIPASGPPSLDHHAAHRGFLGDGPGQDARTAGERREASCGSCTRRTCSPSWTSVARSSPAVRRRGDQAPCSRRTCWAGRAACGPRRLAGARLCHCGRRGDPAGARPAAPARRRAARR